MFFQKMDSNPPKRDSNLKDYFLNRTFEINNGFESKSNGFKSNTVKHDSNKKNAQSTYQLQQIQVSFSSSMLSSLLILTN